MGKPKSRGNKTGSVFYRKDRKCWLAQIVVGWKEPVKEDGKLVPIKKTLSGFKTKKEALAALNMLLNGDQPADTASYLDDVFRKWQEIYSPRVKPKTMNGYRQAYNHFQTLKFRKISTITAVDLQKCMDDCTAGKRTHQLMKVTAGLIWAYALDANIVKKDVTSNLYIGKHVSTKRAPLTPQDVELIKSAIGKIRYAEYVYCLCYLGYRPGEFLEIKKEQVKTEVINSELVYYIVEGIKTEAGIDRTVVIPKQILPYILERLWIPGTEYLFPFYLYRRNKDELVEMRRMTINYFDSVVFKNICEKLDIVGKVPYSARHTYADKLKHADGDARDKAALLGHTDYDFTRRQYQTSPLEDLKAVTDTIE